MGGANTICSDKTGTLTKNKMTVTNIWSGRSQEVKTNDASFKFADYFNNQHHSDLLQQAISGNCSGSLREASATEKAMMEFIIKFGTDMESDRKTFLPEDFVRFHFTSKRKRMTTILQNVGKTEFGYDRRAHIKGASEIVLGSCTHYLTTDGQKNPLHDDMKSNLNTIIAEYATQSLRTICFGYKDLKPGEGGPTHEDMDSEGVIHAIEKTDFTLICILGIKDIIREEVPGAVAKCQMAGITVRMVTGDNRITARAISMECKILTEKQAEHHYSCLEGPEFYEMIGGLICKNCSKDSPCDCPPKLVKENVKNLKLFKDVTKHLRVLARSRPEDKYLLVTGLRQIGNVVAVTGDGTNDAPALKKADVGFAMGLTGTDVAKHAADIIITDDNFASIVQAVMWGRNIYDNIRKFLQFQLTCNVVAMFTALVGSVILKESPLQPVQLLWVNLIMDSLGSLALATEPPKPSLLTRPPHSRHDYIVSRKMFKHIILMSFYQIGIVYAIVFGGPTFFPESESKWMFDKQNGLIYSGQLTNWDGTPGWSKYENEYGASRHLTIAFNIFVCMQIVNMINARKIHDEKNVFQGIHENCMYIGIWLFICVGQFIIVTYGDRALKVCKDGLTWQHWVICIIAGITTLPMCLLFKFVPDKICPEFGSKKKNPLVEDDTNVLGLRKNRSSSFSIRNA
jgi:Ca2+ transporting ATPase